MPKYLLIDESGSIFQADTYGEDELEAVIDGVLSIIDISDPEDLKDMDQDGDWTEVEDWVK